jgi:hypothetical protein
MVSWFKECEWYYRFKDAYEPLEGGTTMWMSCKIIEDNVRQVEEVVYPSHNKENCRES